MPIDNERITQVAGSKIYGCSLKDIGAIWDLNQDAITFCGEIVRLKEDSPGIIVWQTGFIDPDCVKMRRI